MAFIYDKPSQPAPDFFSLREAVEKLGLDKVVENVYERRIECSKVDYCTFSIVGNRLSIRVGKENDDYERQILRQLYVPDEYFFLTILSRLAPLKLFFPDIVNVPEFDQTG